MKTTASHQLFEQAQRLFPGGVNSPVRAWRSVGGEPPVIVRGQGARVFDADGNAFLDYVCSWGPLILGHAQPGVVQAVAEAARHGTSFGMPGVLEIELGRRIQAALPSLALMRFTSSGTEATMSALRLARAFTGRDKIIKFDGGYHGHADPLLARAGSGVATFSLPDSAGVPAAVAATTLIAPYNDLDAVQRLLEPYEQSIAAVIVEPVAGNMGVVPPAPGFLQGLRALTRQYGALLIFDEVITGFRLAWGGAQGLYGVQPDLTCLGKIIGGGLPVGAYGGRRDIMEKVAPLGPVYQAGTLSGNPVAMAAGIATLDTLAQTAGAYDLLERRAARLVSGSLRAANDAGVPLTVNRVGSMLTAFFTDQPVTDYASARTSDTRRYAAFFHGLIERGIHLAPSQFEAAFLSLAHTEQDVEDTAAAIAEALRGLAP